MGFYLILDSHVYLEDGRVFAVEKMEEIKRKDSLNYLIGDPASWMSRNYILMNGKGRKLHMKVEIQKVSVPLLKIDLLRN